jgi:hypothetical protein
VQVIARLEKGVTAMLNFDFTPNLGGPNDEPSLRELIFRYYEEHSDKEEAELLTNMYILECIKNPFTLGQHLPD